MCVAVFASGLLVARDGGIPPRVPAELSMSARSLRPSLCVSSSNIPTKGNFPGFLFCNSVISPKSRSFGTDFETRNFAQILP